MGTALKGFWGAAINPLCWTGPVFGKELRVSSRRKRNYLVRSLYVLLLTVFVVIVWSSAVEGVLSGSSSVSYITSRMSAAGAEIISAIVIFQFIVTQIAAVVMLSTSISDEIYHKTLGTLMSTPINSFQIVTGKLLSKLLQVIILIALSLPLLAVVRVFGGVPWGYILSSTCVTLTAVIFAGSMSMYFSISGRRAYEVILKTVFTLGVIYTFAPWILAFLAVRSISFANDALLLVIMFTNPFFVMQAKTAEVMGAGGVPMMGRFGTYICWVHCAIMLIASGLVLARCITIVRRVALLQATGGADAVGSRSSRRKRRKKERTSKSPAREVAGAIRRVTGAPVVWKELRRPLVQGGKVQGRIAAAGAVVALAVTYVVCIRERCLHAEFCHVTYTVVFMLLGLIATTVLSATAISAERESRCWPLLLATSMDDREILVGKAMGVVRRCAPIWSLLAGHVLLFVLVRYIHPIAVIQLAMVVLWAIVFLTGVGLYFSTVCRRSTSAVVSTVAFAAVLWIAIPAMLGLMMGVLDSETPFLAYVSTNPVVQAGVIMAGAGGESNAHVGARYLEYPWPAEDMFGTSGRTTLMLMGTTVVYAGAGLLFAWRAKCRFRRRIF